MTQHRISGDATPGRRCTARGSAFSEVSHGIHASAPGMRYCPGSGEEYSVWLQRSRQGNNLPCLGPEELELATTIYNRRKGRSESYQPGPRTPATPAPADVPEVSMNTGLIQEDTRVATPRAPLRSRRGAGRKNVQPLPEALQYHPSPWRAWPSGAG